MIKVCLGVDLGRIGEMDNFLQEFPLFRMGNTRLLVGEIPLRTIREFPYSMGRIYLIILQPVLQNGVSHNIYAA
jgi:hypothetical protein